jgi:hypothetical protein
MCIQLWYRCVYSYGVDVCTVIVQMCVQLWYRCVYSYGIDVYTVMV